ncbi:MAG: hypothetical protein GQ578_07645 [Desulfuromonadaceae bacterium]|nr:hypothetical protein [Desulfuromonadaceae bacterium]
MLWKDLVGGAHPTRLSTIFVITGRVGIAHQYLDEALVGWALPTNMEAIDMSYKPYAKYKPSGVEWIGEIPEGWEVKRFKHIAYIEMGQSPSSTDCNIDGLGTPFLQGCAEFGNIHPEQASCSYRKSDVLGGKNRRKSSRRKLS